MIPVMPTDVLSAALAYLDHGWSVIPILPGDKKPAVKWEPYQKRKPTPDEWHAWTRATKDLNIALVTGEVSGVTVVDVDGQAGRDSMAPHNGRLPKTLLQQSPHGWHMFFAYEPGVRNKARLLPGVDVRGEGGYVLVAPSRLPDAAYAWKRVTALQPFPRWLVDADKAPDVKGGKVPTDQPRWVTDALRNGAVMGARNQMAARLAGYLFGRAHPEDVVRAILEPYRLACKPEMPAGELDDVVRSQSRYRRHAVEAGVLNPPTVQRTVAGERYLWDDLQATVRNPIRIKSSIVAEVALTLDVPGVPRTVRAPVTLNLLSQRERDGLAQSLRRAAPEVDWDTRIDVLARLAVESVRKGEPAVLLRDARRKVNGDAYALKPLLLADSPTIWYADGGTGKSLLALAAACAISGHDVFAGVRPSVPRRVLYLDWEWEPEVHAERLAQIVGEDLDAADILYRRCYGSLADEIDAIRQTVADEEVSYVIIDSLGAACGGDLTDADTALRFANHIRALHVGSLWITHVTKNGGDGQEKPYGSVYFHNSARLIWRMQRQSEPGASEIAVGLYNTKANGTTLHKAVGLRLRFEGERLRIDSTDVRSYAELGKAREVPLYVRICDELARGPMTPAEVAAELGTTKGTVQSKLTGLLREGKVVKVGDGTWCLPTDEAYRAETVVSGPVSPSVSGPVSEVPTWMDDAPWGGDE